MSVELLPHGPPLNKGCFTSSYDATYTKIQGGGSGSTTLPKRATSAQPLRSGHQANNAAFRLNIKGMSGLKSTAQQNHSPNVHSHMGDSEFRSVAYSAVSPKEIATAHVRNQSHIGGAHADGKVPQSTMKDSYALRRPVSSASSFRQMHPGSAAVQWNPRFLAIDSPDDVQKKKTMQSSPAKAHRPRQDACLNISVKAINAYTEGPMDAEAEQRLKVSSPVEYHVHRNQRPYVTQSSVIGDTTSVVHGSLKGVNLSETSDKNQIVLVGNKRSLLNTLAGYDTKKERPSSGAARMGGMVHQGAPLGGPLGGRTTYRHEFFNRKTLPETADPHHSKTKQLDKAVFVALNKHSIDFSATKALDNVRTTDGGLKSEKPAGVHPSVWVRLQRAESKALSENQDPHRHKRRE